MERHLLEAALFVIVLLASTVGVAVPLHLWFRRKWRTAHRGARLALKRFARDRGGKYSSGRRAPKAGLVRLELSGCPCRVSYDIYWVHHTGEGAAVSKSVGVTTVFRVDLRDVSGGPLEPLGFVVAVKKYAGTSGPDEHDLSSTKFYEVPPETAILGSDRLRDRLGKQRDMPSVEVERTKRGLRFAYAGMAPLEDMADHVAWCVDMYVRATDEANRPGGKLYRSSTTR
jgi:hypothetical protein